MTRFPEYEFANERYMQYEGGATFVRRCVLCFRFVKPDNTVKVNDAVGLIDEQNATCSKCGRTKMLFVGFVGEL